MWVLKGALFIVGLFIVFLVALVVAFSRRHVMFPVQWMTNGGLFAIGVGFGLLIIGGAVSWLGKIAEARLLSRMPH